jgi:hypothetical protein
MPHCRTAEPPAQQVTGGAAHLSACWLPPDVTGTSDSSAARRREAAGREGRSAAGVPPVPAQDGSVAR